MWGEGGGGAWCDFLSVVQSVWTGACLITSSPSSCTEFPYYYRCPHFEALKQNLCFFTTDYIVY